MIRSIYLVDFALFVKGKTTNFTRFRFNFLKKMLRFEVHRWLDFKCHL